MKSYPIPGEAASQQPYVTLPGTEVYEQESLTSLNRWPVMELAAYVLAGFEVLSGRAPFDEEDAVEMLIVQGPLVVLNPLGSVDPEVEPTFIGSVLSASQTEVRCYIPPATASGKAGIGVYSRTKEGEDWTYQAYTVGTDGAETPDGLASYYDAAVLFVQPSKPAPYYWAQHTYNRLEEIEREIRLRQEGGASKTTITGVDDPDAAAVQYKRRDISTVFLPEGVVHPPATSVIGQLLDEYRELKTDYYAALSVLEHDAPNRPVGADRELRMRPMLQRVRRLRSRLSRAFAKFGCEVKFDNIVVSDPAQRGTERQLLKDLQADGVIENLDDYKKLARGLIGAGA